MFPYHVIQHLVQQTQQGAGVAPNSAGAGDASAEDHPGPSSAGASAGGLGALGAAFPSPSAGSRVATRHHNVTVLFME